MVTFIASCKMLWVQPANWNTTSYLAHDLGILPQPKFKDLNTNIVEVKRMLSALIRKVDEERKKDGL